MNRRSNPTAFVAVLLCVALLFSRVALAAFACPAAMLAAPAAQGEDCAKGGSGLDPLCVKSCNDEPQKHEPGAAVTIPPALVSALWVPLATPAVASARAPDPALARANAPPPTILFARLRE